MLNDLDDFFDYDNGTKTDFGESAAETGIFQDVFEEVLDYENDALLLSRSFISYAGEPMMDKEVLENWANLIQTKLPKGFEDRHVEITQLTFDGLTRDQQLG
jgi:hypothetical protein